MEKNEQKKKTRSKLILIKHTFIFVLFIILVVAIYLGCLHVLDDIVASLPGNHLWFINFIKMLSKFIIGFIILFSTSIFISYQFSFTTNSKNTGKKEG